MFLHRFTTLRSLQRFSAFSRVCCKSMKTIQTGNVFMPPPAWCFLPCPFRLSVRSSVITLVKTIFWIRMNRFRSKVAQMVRRARAWRRSRRGGGGGGVGGGEEGRGRGGWGEEKEKQQQQQEEEEEHSQSAKAQMSTENDPDCLPDRSQNVAIHYIV